jgi:hypothetical protein
MSNADAFTRFIDAARTFHGVEDRLRAGDDAVELRMIDGVVIDLDAAIPGLTDVDLGRALVLKGHVLWWRNMLEMRKEIRSQTSRGRVPLFDVDKSPDPRMAEAFSSASKGFELLKTHGTDHDRSWAEDVVSKLQP